MLVTVCCLLCLFASAQTVWNRTYIEDRPTMLFTSIVTTDDGFCVSGVTTGTPNNTAKAMLGVLDTSGLLTNYFAIGDSVNANYGLFWNNLMTTKDGKLAFAGYCYDSLPSVLLTFAFGTDSVHSFRYYYPQSSGFQAYSLIQYNDSSFFIAGGRTDSISNNVDMVLLKVNSQGQLQWQKKYNQYIFDYASKVTGLANGNLMLGGARNNLSQGNQKSNTWLLEVDTGGSFVRQWFDPNDSTYAAEGLRQTKDGGFIYGAQKKLSESGGLVVHTFIIVKMDNNFNKQWTYNGGFKSIYTGIHDIEELEDGSFIACGQYPIYGTDTTLWGCIVKLNANGNAIWERNYRGINVSQTLNFLTDIDVLPNGGFIAVGQCQNNTQQPSQVGWFLKLDSNGCEIENCLVGIDPQTPEGGLNSQIQVYPNPASGVVQMEVSSELIGGEVKVYDVHGRVVKKFEVSSFQVSSLKLVVDVSDWSKGMYVITAEKEGMVARGKLVVE